MADRETEKLESATDVGADHIMEWSRESSKEDLVNTISVSGYNKIDAAIDFVGSPMTFDVCVESLNNGGCLTEVGLIGGESSVSIPMLISRNISIQGIRIAGLTMFKEFVSLFGKQDVRVYPPITFLGLERINYILENLRKGKVQGRAVIKYI